jgi:hypothetical protein
MDNAHRRLGAIAAPALALGTLLAAGCSTTGAAGGPSYNATGLGAEETSIPFARMDSSIHDWQADGQNGLWVQDGRRDWYYAKLLGPCYGLDWANAIGIEPRGSQLDKFGFVLVPRERSRCQFTSFRRSDPPPPKGKKKEDAAAPAAATPAAPRAAPN